MNANNPSNSEDARARIPHGLRTVALPPGWFCVGGKENSIII